MSECEKCLELHKLIAAEERISELEAENAKQAEAVDGWIHSVADLQFSLKNLNAQLAEHEDEEKA